MWHAERENSDYLAFRNKNKTIRQFEGGNGIKIGYTENSGRTLVASAKRGDEEVICVVMSALTGSTMLTVLWNTDLRCCRSYIVQEGGSLACRMQAPFQNSGISIKV